MKKNIQHPTDRMTLSVKPHEVERKWYIIDAAGKTLGRLASQIATILRGKQKPYYTPHVDCGDFVIVINAEKVRVAEKRQELKEYRWYTGYPGGLRKASFRYLQQKHPELLIERAVKRMLPKNRLQKRMLKRLKVYRGSTHPHQAQKPQELQLPFRCS